MPYRWIESAQENIPSCGTVAECKSRRDELSPVRKPFRASQPRHHLSLSCGQVVSEPAREVWDPVSTVPGGSHRGPPVTPAERASWQSDPRLTPRPPVE